MEGILEQILQELEEIKKQLQILSDVQGFNSTRTAGTLPDIITVNDIRKYLNVGISKAYEIINKDQFTHLQLGRKKGIPKNEFIDWYKKEQALKKMGLIK